MRWIKSSGRKRPGSKWIEGRIQRRRIASRWVNAGRRRRARVPCTACPCAEWDQRRRPERRAAARYAVRHGAAGDGRREIRPAAAAPTFARHKRGLAKIPRRARKSIVCEKSAPRRPVADGAGGIIGRARTDFVGRKPVRKFFDIRQGNQITGEIIVGDSDVAMGDAGAGIRRNAFQHQQQQQGGKTVRAQETQCEHAAIDALRLCHDAFIKHNCGAM